MKMFICSIIIFALMLIGSNMYAGYLNNTIEQFEGIVYEMSVSAQNTDWNECKNTMQRFMKEWKQVYPTLEYFIHHNDIDRINHVVYELDGCIKTENKNDFMIKNDVLLNLLHELPKDEKISIENIL